MIGQEEDGRAVGGGTWPAMARLNTGSRSCIHFIRLDHGEKPDSLITDSYSHFEFDTTVVMNNAHEA